MLVRLIVVAVVLIALYYVATELLPRGGGAPSGTVETDGSGQCVARAEAASQAVAGELVALARPPLDSAAWGPAVVRAGTVLSAADSACACPEPACARASEALDELRTLVAELEELARGDPRGLGNPARRQERVDRLLDEARALAAGG